MWNIRMDIGWCKWIGLHLHWQSIQYNTILFNSYWCHLVNNQLMTASLHITNNAPFDGAIHMHMSSFEICCLFSLALPTNVASFLSPAILCMTPCHAMWSICWPLTAASLSWNGSITWSHHVCEFSPNPSLNEVEQSEITASPQGRGQNFQSVK